MCILGLRLRPDPKALKPTNENHAALENPSVTMESFCYESPRTYIIEGVLSTGYEIVDALVHRNHIVFKLDVHRAMQGLSSIKRRGARQPPAEHQWKVLAAP